MEEISKKELLKLNFDSMITFETARDIPPEYLKRNILERFAFGLVEILEDEKKETPLYIKKSKDIKCGADVYRITINICNDEIHDLIQASRFTSIKDLISWAIPKQVVDKYKCPICGKISNMDCLTGERDNFCSNCGQKLIYTNSIVEHKWNNKGTGYILSDFLTDFSVYCASQIDHELYKIVSKDVITHNPELLEIRESYVSTPKFDGLKQYEIYFNKEIRGRILIGVRDNRITVTGTPIPR